MVFDFDESRENLITLAASYGPHDRNEAQTRFVLIDSLLFDCLGWDRSFDCQVEEQYEQGYADYVLSGSYPLLIGAHRANEKGRLPKRVHHPRGGGPILAQAHARGHWSAKSRVTCAGPVRWRQLTLSDHELSIRHRPMRKECRSHRVVPCGPEHVERKVG